MQKFSINLSEMPFVQVALNMSVRIIAGVYKGRKIETLFGETVRPTLDRVKETLFNVLQFDINENSRVLDCFSGSGNLGIEALSRGAAYASFCDINPNAIEIIKKNLIKLGVPEDKYSVRKGSIGTANKGFTWPRTDGLSQAADTENRAQRPLSTPSYDIVFVDPPYVLSDSFGNTFDGRLYYEVFETLERNNLVKENAIVACEHLKRFPLPKKLFGFSAYKTKEIGIVGLTFYLKG